MIITTYFLATLATISFLVSVTDALPRQRGQRKKQQTTKQQKKN